MRPDSGAVSSASNGTLFRAVVMCSRPCGPVASKARSVAQGTGKPITRSSWPSDVKRATDQPSLSAAHTPPSLSKASPPSRPDPRGTVANRRMFPWPGCSNKMAPDPGVVASSAPSCSASDGRQRIAPTGSPMRHATCKRPSDCTRPTAVPDSGSSIPTQSLPPSSVQATKVLPCGQGSD